MVKGWKKISRKVAKTQRRVKGFGRAFAPLRETFLLNLDDSALAVLSCSTVMNLSLHRYYYYYGPLSDGRDGQAMGCRRALTM